MGDIDAKATPLPTFAADTAGPEVEAELVDEIAGCRGDLGGAAPPDVVGAATTAAGRSPKRAEVAGCKLWKDLPLTSGEPGTPLALELLVTAFGTPAVCVAVDELEGVDGCN
jgi:hypothetical protein